MKNHINDNKCDICFIYRQESTYPPLGILSLTSYLREHGFTTEIIYTADTFNELDKVKELDPLIVAFSVTSGTEDFYLNIARTVKAETDAVTMFGGAHPTFFKEIIHEDGVDCICVGEGEYALEEALNIYKESLELSALKEVQNLHVKLDGEVYENPVRNLIEDLALLPSIDRKDEEDINSRTLYMLSGRGCPYQCSYCHNHSLMKLYKHKGTYVRKRPVQQVLDEIKGALELKNVDMVRFVDDTFIIDRVWFADFADRYKKEIGIPYTCGVRANLMNTDIAKQLKDSGCVHISLALEAGNDAIRNEMLKRNITREKMIAASEMIRDVDIAFTMLNIVGLPETNLAHEIETLDLNIKCKPTIARAFLFQPYPGTDLGDYCKDNELIADELSFSLWGHSDSVLDLPDIKERKVIQTLFGLIVDMELSSGTVYRLCKMKSLLPVYRIVAKFHYAYKLLFKTHLLKMRDLFKLSFLKAAIKK